MKIYKIVWYDIVVSAGWNTRLETKDSTPLPAFSVGVIVSDRKDNILLSSTVADNGNFNNLICIPKGAIISKEVIGEHSWTSG